MCLLPTNYPYYNNKKNVLAVRSFIILTWDFRSKEICFETVFKIDSLISVHFSSIGMPLFVALSSRIINIKNWKYMFVVIYYTYNLANQLRLFTNFIWYGMIGMKANIIPNGNYFWLLICLLLTCLFILTFFTFTILWYWK